jgi:hypothetical protein
LELGNQIVWGESHRTGFFNEPVDKVTQDGLGILTISCFEMASAYKRSHASSRFQHTRAFQFRIDFCDRVGVYAKFDSQLSDSWQLLTDLQPASHDRKLDCSR